MRTPAHPQSKTHPLQHELQQSKTMANGARASPRTCDVRSSRSRVSLSNIDTSFVVYVVNVAREKSRVCDDFVPKVQQRDPGFGAAGLPVSRFGHVRGRYPP